MINKIIKKEMTPNDIIKVFNGQGGKESKRNVAVLVELGRIMTNHLGKKGNNAAMADNFDHLAPLLNKIAGAKFSFEDPDKLAENTVKYMPHHIGSRTAGHWQANFSIDAVNAMIEIEAQVIKEREALANKGENLLPAPQKTLDVVASEQLPQQHLVPIKPPTEKMMAQQSAVGSVLGTISEWLQQAAQGIKKFVKKALHISDSPDLIR